MKDNNKQNSNIDSLVFMQDSIPGKKFILKTMTILVTVALTCFSIYLYSKGNRLVPTVNLITVIILIINFMIAKKTGNFQGGLNFVIGLMATHLLFIFTKSMEMAMWSFVFPWAVFFIFGTSKGQILSTLYLVVGIVILSIDYFKGGGIYSFDFVIRFPVIYSTILIFSYFYSKEQTRAFDFAKQRNENFIHKNLQFNTLLSCGKTVYIVIDHEGIISYANSGVVNIFGHSAEELIKTCFFEKIHSDDLNKVRTLIDKVLNDSTFTDVGCEFRYHFKDVRWIFVECNIQDLKDNPSINGILITVHEVTARKLAEQKIISINEKLEAIVNERTEKLRQSEERLRQSEKMEALGQLAGGIAHDFNNQLAGIISCADLLMMTVDHEKDVEEMIDTIIISATQAAKLIDQLLAFARKGTYQRVPVDIHKIINVVFSLLEHSIDKKIKLEKELNAEKSIINGDYAQLQNVFLNLALNARDAMTGGGTIKFTTDVLNMSEQYVEQDETVEEGEGLFVLTVSDTGLGMDIETQKHIFEPFFTTKQVGQGTGMGLAAVYGTIESHGGIISVNSTPDSGSTFSIYLPLSSANENIDVESIPIQNKSKKTNHIMIVEDEETVRNSVDKILRKLGYKVTICKDGYEAIDVYKEKWEDIDLVMLDMIMPEVDGYQTFQELSQINPDLRVLLCSGYILNNNAQKIVDSEKHGFIQKPYRISALAREISNLIM